MEITLVTLKENTHMLLKSDTGGLNLKTTFFMNIILKSNFFIILK